MIPIHYNGSSDVALKSFANKLQEKIQGWVRVRYVGDAGSNVPMDQRAYTFFSKLNHPDAIWDIINLPADKLLGFISDLERDYPELATDRTNKDHNNHAAVSQLYKCIEKAFSNYGYDSEVFPSIDIIEDVNISVCPYCNRNFVKHIEVGQNANGKPKSVKAELDHFYPRSLFPYLAISRHNLVPCCHDCNGQSGKHNKDTRKFAVINPYTLTTSNGMAFRMKIKSGTKFLNLSTCADSIEIQLDTTANPALSANDAIFHLEKIYNTHTDYAAEVYYKHVLRQNGIYLNATKESLKKRGLHMTNEDICRLQLGIYTNEKEFADRPLSKFIADIAKQYGLIPQRGHGK